MIPRHRRPKPFWFALTVMAAVLVSGCRSEPRTHSSTSGTSTEPTDSLALSGRAGTEVWFTLARVAYGKDGRACLERGLEIRRAGSRVPVPLLYTGETPTLIDDTTMRAVLWTHCQPLDPYLVDLRTGRPIRERRSEDR